MRKATLTFITFLLTYLLLEGLSFAAYGLLYGKAFSYYDLAGLRAQAQSSWKSEAQGNDAQESALGVLHPYLGYVWEPEPSQDTTRNFITRYGLWAERDPIAASRDPKLALVAITGGSVAEYFYEMSRDTLRRYLQALPAFEDKEIVFFMLGRGTWKQPQQLLSVAYYLTQGGRLDMLINLDGLNETFYASDKSGEYLYPLYPRGWPDLLAGSHLTAQSLTQLGDIAFWRKTRHGLAALFSPLRFSVTASTLWSLADRYVDRRAVAAEEALGENQQKPYYLTGPDTLKEASRPRLNRFLADAWEKASLELHYLARANRFYYFHFLQPNQYVAGSKPFTAEERAQYFDNDAWTKAGVEEIYPLYAPRIENLRKLGVAVESLTDVYKNTRETVYKDSCCHVNQLGNDLMAKAMGKFIAAQVTARKAH